MPPRPSLAQRRAEKERRESVCAAIVCDVLGNGARWRRRDLPGGQPGLHDFDLEFSNGHCEALEVCAFTEGEAEAQRDALDGTKLLESQVLGRYWFVAIPDRGLDLGALHAGSFLPRIEAQLVVLEGHGRFEFDRADQWTLMLTRGRNDPVVEASRVLAEMRIQRASSLPPPSGCPPTIELQVSTGGAVDPQSVNRAVEDRATESGNVSKLRAATHATAGHIFVPIYFGAPMTFMAVRHVELSSTPTLPPEVTRAWVIGGSNGVLFVEPPDSWKSVPYSPLATSNPENWQAR